MCHNCAPGRVFTAPGRRRKALESVLGMTSGTPGYVAHTFILRRLPDVIVLIKLVYNARINGV
jgi:hypothetical protein